MSERNSFFVNRVGSHPSNKTNIEDNEKNKRNNMNPDNNNIEKLLIAVNAIQSDINSIKSDISVMKDNITTLKSEVLIINNNISNIKENISTLKTEVITINNNISNIKEDVSSLELFNGKVELLISDSAQKTTINLNEKIDKKLPTWYMFVCPLIIISATIGYIFTVSNTINGQLSVISAQSQVNAAEINNLKELLKKP